MYKVLVTFMFYREMRMFFWRGPFENRERGGGGIVFQTRMGHRERERERKRKDTKNAETCWDGVLS